MPKVKIPRKSTSVDMTAMCDVSFLLLTFFILTSKFKPSEPVAIDLPNSRSEIQVNNAIRISVDKDGKAYINYPDASIRIKALAKMGEVFKNKYPYLSTLTDKQRANFAQTETFGFDAAAHTMANAHFPDGSMHGLLEGDHDIALNVLTTLAFPTGWVCDLGGI